MTTTTVELQVTDNGLSFTLDNTVKGVLDNTTYVLPLGFKDISEWVSSVSVGRGKNRELEKFSAGSMSVELFNRDRTFDPSYAASPFYGDILPRRQMRVLVDGVQQFVGYINDWSFSYDVSGESLVSVSLSDAFTVLSNQELQNVAVSEQLSGARVSTVLNSAGWGLSERLIDSGNSVVAAGTATGNVLNYLQQVESSEQGSLFIGKSGDVVFQARNAAQASGSAVVFADDGSGIPFSGANISYSSDLLFNQAVVNWPGGTAIGNANNVPNTLLWTNYINNPTFRVDTASWNVIAPATLVRSGTQGIVEMPSAGETAARIYTVNNLEANTRYVFGAIVLPYENADSVRFEASGAGVSALQDYTYGFWGSGQTIRFEFTTTSAGSANLYIGLYNATGITPGNGLIVRRVHLQKLPANVSSGSVFYFDGSFADTPTVDYSWSGTANNSSSYRLETYPFIDSQRIYGVIANTIDTLLASEATAIDFANYFANAYAQPQYRFSDLKINLKDPQVDSSQMLNLDIGSLVEVKYTPNNTGTQIDQLAYVTKLQHDIGVDSHVMVVGITPIAFIGLILDDAVYGILDSNKLAF